MGSVHGAAAQSGIRSVCDQFPKLPQASFAAASASDFLPSHATVAHDPAIAAFDLHSGSRLPFRQLLERGHLKRGPPSFLS
jgi:hypothetical protein